MAHTTGTDDGFREIQLNGKQLVFLFMAATVVSVVIFLCGVLVGRGVRPLDEPASSEPALAAAPPESAPISALTDGTAASPAAAEPPDEPAELSYYERLEGEGPAPETLRTPAPEPAPEPAAAQPPAVSETVPAAAPRRPEPAPPVASATEPAQADAISGTDPQGPGYAVQVAALRARGDANSMAERLSSKGYPAYVLSPAAGGPVTVYRVRVGKFPTLQEANRVAARLEAEERFQKPWVIR